MEKKDEKVIHVSMHETDMNALLSILNVIKECGMNCSDKDAKQAEKIMEIIMKYRKPYRRKDGKGYTLCFYESQTALMIKFFALTVRAIMEPIEEVPKDIA